jgi:hypothetical protein
MSLQEGPRHGKTQQVEKDYKRGTREEDAAKALKSKGAKSSLSMVENSNEQQF